VVFLHITLLKFAVVVCEVCRR